MDGFFTSLICIQTLTIWSVRHSLLHATGRSLERRNRALDIMGLHSGLARELLVDSALIKWASVIATRLCDW